MRHAYGIVYPLSGFFTLDHGIVYPRSGFFTLDHGNAVVARYPPSLMGGNLRDSHIKQMALFSVLRTTIIQ